MSVYPGPDPTPTPAPTPPPAVTPAAGSEAEQFLQSELAHARRGLTITRIASAGIALFVVGYMSYVTNRFQDALEPQHAAQIANGIIAEQVEKQTPQLVADVKQRVPALIAQLPDYALSQLPEYRKQLEDKVVGDLTGYANSTSKELGEHLDDFLGAHKEEVGQMIEDGQNPEIVARVGNSLEAEFMDYLKHADAGGGESYQAKLDASLVSLQQIKTRMDRLANGKDLTPTEKKARRAIALLAAGVDEQREALAPNGIVPAALSTPVND